MSISGSMTRWLPLVLYSALIFYLSSSPPPEFANEISGGDKVLHLGAYTVWGLLCGWALAGNCPGLSGPWFVLIVTAAGTLYGFSDELHQSFVKERIADPWDLFADLMGSLLGACVALAWMRRRRPRESPVPTESQEARPKAPPEEFSHGEEAGGNGSRGASG